MQAKQRKALDSLLNQQELAESLGVTVQSIIMWEREGMIPAYRRGYFVLYDRDHVEDWLFRKRRKKQTVPNRWKRNRNSPSSEGTR